MDMNLTPSIRAALYIRTADFKVVDQGLLTMPPEVCKHLAVLGKALAQEKFGNQQVCPEPAYRTDGSEALLLFQPWVGNEGAFDKVQLDLTGYALLLNDISERIRANALLRFSRAVEDVVESKNTLKIVTTLARLRDCQCEMGVYTHNGELRVLPPPTEALATPDKAEEASLKSLRVTGCDKIQEGGCVLTLGFEYYILCPQAAADWGPRLLIHRARFTGKIVKTGSTWAINSNEPFEFAPDADSDEETQGQTPAAHELFEKPKTTSADKRKSKVKPKKKSRG